MSRVSWDEAVLRGSTPVRVYFADTDQMGVVYNGKYLTWFEIGRTELMRHHGMDYATIETRGIALPVTEARFRIRQPARYDDLVTIETALAPVRTREVCFLYQILRGETRLVEGETCHVAVDRATGKATRVPDWLFSGLR